MRREVLLLIARHFWVNTFKSKAIYFLIGAIAILLLYAAFSGVSYHDHNHFREDHQHMARESWEANPDKHPHRMAHFGTFAFRQKHPLSIFDFGMENYTGNAVFLEAHKQNTVNFSEAGFSTGLLRFGELSMAMILHTLLPLVIFFIGYAAVVSDRENGTLRILLTQGASWREILVGKSFGLFAVSMVFFLPFIITILVLLINEGHFSSEIWGRVSLITGIYIAFIFVLCLITIYISASSQYAKNALMKLLGLWLMMVILLPRTSQALGAYFHPTPTKLEFRSAIEEEVIAFGDSHNPDDPHYSALKDSLLDAYQVSSVAELPFNFGGFIMKEGEKISAEIYTKHHDQLLDQYRKQNQLTHWFSVINPYLAIKNLSMSLCGTGFESYASFHNQSEDYRYELAQAMNELQMKYISPDKVHGSEGKAHVVSRDEWQAVPDFQYQFMRLGTTLRTEIISVTALVLWFLLSITVILYLSRKPNVL